MTWGKGSKGKYHRLRSVIYGGQGVLAFGQRPEGSKGVSPVDSGGSGDWKEEKQEPEVGCAQGSETGVEGGERVTGRTGDEVERRPCGVGFGFHSETGCKETVR